MSNNKGKYDDLCEEVHKKVNAHTVMLVVGEGNRGSGFSISSVDPSFIHCVPKLLRTIAYGIEEQLRVEGN